MFEIQVKSPTRVDLAGGTLDLWPFFAFLPNPVTINVAIDIFTYVDLKELPGKEIVVESADLGLKKTYSDIQALRRDADPAFDFLRPHLDYWAPERGFSLRTRSESPIGGGLGGSSSLCISLLKAFSAWMKKPMDTYKMVETAHNLEANTLLKPTGTQDYFGPILGGLNMITYTMRGPEVETRPIDRALFDDRFLLVYTGRSHHSGMNNWQVLKNYIDGDEKTQRILAELRLVAADMKKAFDTGKLENLKSLFEREYQFRSMIEGFASPEIDRISKAAKSVGSVAKICGAGGGGCVLIWCPDRQINEAKDLCSKEGFLILNARPWEG